MIYPQNVFKLRANLRPFLAYHVLILLSTFDKFIRDEYHKDMKMTKKETSTEHSFTVMYEPVRGGGYQITVPVLPGVISYGRDVEEAKKMARDAIRCHIEGLQKEHEPIPSERSLLQERLTISFA
jgi:predicted RNase H-like HicB family nuclease